MKWTWAFWRWFGRDDESARLERFASERPTLEGEFFRAAGRMGKPRGLRWKAIDWQPGAVFARDRESDELLALVGITIAFEAIVGSDMEGVAAVGNLRHASAVFHHRQGRWLTLGRAVFNLAPDEVLIHFNHQYEPLALPPPANGPEPPAADNR